MRVIRLGVICIAIAVIGCSGKSPEIGSQLSSTPPSAPADVMQGIPTAKPPDTPEMLAEKRAKRDTNLRAAQDSAAKGDLDRAIQLLEDAVLLDSRHREVLLLLTQYSQARSKSLITSDPARSYRLMVQAGGYLRMLREAHQDFSGDEREIIAQVLFDEACAHARANRQGEFSASLREAMDAGFSNLTRLESEADFNEFRRNPEMAKLLSEAIVTVKSRVATEAP